MPFAVTQQRFRFYNDDGSITTATAAAAENANLSIADGGGNKSYHLLIQMQETGGTNGATTDDWQLQYSKNAGAWTNVTTTSANVKAFDSANLTDAGGIATGDFRLTAGTGTAQAGSISEDGLLDDFSVRSTQYTEILFTIQTVDADLAATDTLDFRVLYNGATTSVTYSVTPRITNGVLSIATGVSTETDISLSLVTSLAFSPSTETDTTLALSQVQIRPIGLTTEIDTAFALSYVVVINIGTATETDTSLAEGLGLGLITATETDTGLTLGYVQASPVRPAQERNYSWPSGPNSSNLFQRGLSPDFGPDLSDYPPREFRLSNRRDRVFRITNFNRGRPRG